MRVVRFVALLFCCSGLLNVISESYASNVLINEIDLGVPDAIELYNDGATAFNLNGWLLTTGDDVRVQTFTLPAYTLQPGAFVVLIEGTDPPSEGTLFLGLSDKEYTNINWSNSTAGAVKLEKVAGSTADFVQWAEYTAIPSSPAQWTGNDPDLPPSGMNFGRDIHMTDTNDGADIIPQLGSLGRSNDAPPYFLTTSFEPAIIGSQYEQKLNVVGPAGPFTYEIVSGVLPDSLSLDQDGYFRGIPKVSGNYPLYLRVNDSQTPPRSALIYTEMNVYDLQVTFEKNILLVNGVDWGTYSSYIFVSYNEKTFWGDNDVDFWDCFDAPSGGYPNTLPAPRGHGAVPLDVLAEYSTVIWVGNNYNGDLEVWQESPVFQYVKLGGNLLLIARRGRYFIDEEMRQYIGIQWREDTDNEISNYIAEYPGLRSIGVNPYGSSGHTYVAVFNTLLASTESTLLFKETASFSSHRGLGVWKKPEGGGTYRAEGGQVVFLSCRPYCLEAADLRFNVEFILANFLGAMDVSEREEMMPGMFRLGQNYPNPFNGITSVPYSVGRASEVTLRIYNVLGEEIVSLVEGRLLQGDYRVNWDGRCDNGSRAPSGIYYLRYTAGDYTATKKMLYLR